jgi:hypothetical protein
MAAMIAALGVSALALPQGAAADDKRVDFVTGAPAAEDFYDANGLTLSGTCAAGPEMQVTAQSSANNTVIHIGAQGTAGSRYLENDDFDLGETVDVLGGLGTDDDLSGQIVWATPGGSVTVIDFLAEEGDALGGATDCAFTGTAQPRIGDALDSVSQGAVGSFTLFEQSGFAVDGVCDDSPSRMDPIIRASGRRGIMAPNMQALGDEVGAGIEFLAPGDSRSLVDELATGDSLVGQVVYLTTHHTNVSLDFLLETDAFGGPCAFGGVVSVARRHDAANVDYRARAGTPYVTFFKRGGLELRGRCGEANKLSVVARTKRRHATLHMNRQTFAGSTGIADYREQDDFIPGRTGQVKLATIGSGQVIYTAPDGKLLSIDWAGNRDTSGWAGSKNCSWIGTSQLSKP